MVVNHRFRDEFADAMLANRAREGRFSQRSAFIGWNADVDLAQATREWPERKFLYSSTVVEPGQIFLIP